MQSAAMEFHDSKVESITQRENEVIVSFARAFIHKSDGNPGRDPGSVWVQAGEIRLRDAKLTKTLPDLPESLFEGELRIGDHTYQNLVPIPLEREGEAQLTLVIAPQGDRLTIRGSTVALVLLGEAREVEQFPGVS